MYIYKIITLRASRRGQQRIEGTGHRVSPKRQDCSPDKPSIADILSLIGQASDMDPKNGSPEGP